MHNTFTKEMYVSDGAAPHFKNGYKLYELASSSPKNVTIKWFFTATNQPGVLVVRWVACVSIIQPPFSCK
jgi:hypothetical protein